MAEVNGKRMPVKMALVGSREYKRMGLVSGTVSTLPTGSTVVSGGARGVDRVAENAAKVFGLEVVSYRPRKVGTRYVIDRHVITPMGGEITKQIDDPVSFANFRDAAFYRNGLIVRDADRVAAFWDGESNGTQNAISHAREQGKPFRVVGPEGYVIEKGGGEEGR